MGASQRGPRPRRPLPNRCEAALGWLGSTHWPLKGSRALRPGRSGAGRCLNGRRGLAAAGPLLQGSPRQGGAAAIIMHQQRPGHCLCRRRLYRQRWRGRRGGGSGRNARRLRRRRPRRRGDLGRGGVLTARNFKSLGHGRSKREFGRKLAQPAPTKADVEAVEPVRGASFRPNAGPGASATERNYARPSLRRSGRLRATPQTTSSRSLTELTNRKPRDGWP